MELYKDYLPANARIVVDYTAKVAEDKVRFSYPKEWTYWKAVWKQGYLTVLQFWIALHIRYLLIPLLFIILIATFVFMIAMSIVAISNPTTTAVAISTGESPIIFLTAQQVLWLSIGLFYFLGLPAVFTFIIALKKEWISTIVPKLGCWSSLMTSWKERTFEAKDIKRKKAIVPMFSNAFIDYIATKDFGKYLTKVEIMEIPFQSITRTGFFPFGKTIAENNDLMFSAVFHFIKNPKTGTLNVKFS